MTRPPAVDIHAHFFPEGYLKLIAEEGERFGIRFSTSDPRGPVIEVGPLRPAFRDLDIRRKEMDRPGVRVRLLRLR